MVITARKVHPERVASLEPSPNGCPTTLGDSGAFVPTQYFSNY
jgi:hypothetical protein